MQVRAKSIQARAAKINRKLGGSHTPLYGGIVPGMEEERAWEIVQVVIELAPGSRQEGDTYILPNDVAYVIDRNGTFIEAQWAE